MLAMAKLTASVAKLGWAKSMVSLQRGHVAKRDARLWAHTWSRSISSNSSSSRNRSSSSSRRKRQVCTILVLVCGCLGVFQLAHAVLRARRVLLPQQAHNGVRAVCAILCRDCGGVTMQLVMSWL
jgi:hypothetical protein